MSSLNQRYGLPAWAHTKWCSRLFPLTGDPALHIPRAVPELPGNLCRLVLPAVMLLAGAAGREVQLGNNGWIKDKSNKLRP